MNFLKIIENLKEDLKSDLNTFKTVKFFRKDFVSYYVWINVLYSHYNNKSNYIESIIQNIPREFGSRPKIFKVIDLAISKKFLLKESDKKDKRKFILFPSEKTLEEFEEWSKIFKDY